MSSKNGHPVTLSNGTLVWSKTAFWIPEWNAFVPIDQYEKHFIYENNIVNQPSFMCTCGSPAGVAPRGPEGRFQCLLYLQSGRHQS